MSIGSAWSPPDRSPATILDATNRFPDPSIPVTATRRLRAAEAFRLASRMRSTTAVMSVLDCLGIATMSQTDNKMNGSHGAVRDWRAGDDARKQIADWLSMYEAAVRSSGASRGERQGEIRRYLRAGEMQESLLRTNSRRRPDEHGAQEEEEVARKKGRSDCRFALGHPRFSSCVR
jgi:hypothetical protein